MGSPSHLASPQVRLKDGVAEVRAGATLLFDSESAAEEKETELKASAMRDAVVPPPPRLEPR
eukprot:1339989-Prymnesium_polylepis.1